MFLMSDWPFDINGDSISKGLGFCLFCGWIMRRFLFVSYTPQHVRIFIVCIEALEEGTVKDG